MGSEADEAELQASGIPQQSCGTRKNLEFRKITSAKPGTNHYSRTNRNVMVPH